MLYLPIENLRIFIGVRGSPERDMLLLGAGGKGEGLARSRAAAVAAAAVVAAVAQAVAAAAPAAAGAAAGPELRHGREAVRSQVHRGLVQAAVLLLKPR